MILSLTEIIQQLIVDVKNTKLLEYVAVLAGIISVWYSKKEHVWLYPFGLVNTTVFIYLSYTSGLFGEATVNLYYTIMSVIGWQMWRKKDNLSNTAILKISFASIKEWKQHFIFFGCFYIILYAVLHYLKVNFAKNTIPWADAFASATAFTGMWLMNKKKVESWYWWIATNVASIPLYFVKHYVFTSVYYVVLLIMAFYGLAAWAKKANHLQNQINNT